MEQDDGHRGENGAGGGKVREGPSKRVKESPVRKVVEYSSSAEEESDKSLEIEYGNTTVVLSSDREEPPETEGTDTQEEFSLTASGERVVVIVEESDGSQASQASLEAVEKQAGYTIQGEGRGGTVAPMGGDESFGHRSTAPRHRGPQCGPKDRPPDPLDQMGS